jgi:hypothetical protein
MIAGRVVFSGRCNRGFQNPTVDCSLPAGTSARGIFLKIRKMKKIILTSSLMALLFLSSLVANAKPILIAGIQIYWAKWSITLGDCQDGKGLCVKVLTTGIKPDNFLGYDPETDKIILRISKKEQEAGHIIQSNLTIEEDSPIDPNIAGKLIGLKTGGKLVVLKRGIYMGADDGQYYTFSIPYYLK